MSNAPNRGRKKTDFASLLTELGGGVFEQQINQAISDIAANVLQHGKKGKLNISLELKRMGKGNMVEMKHEIRAENPQAKGRLIEEIGEADSLYVGAGGFLSITPETQMDLLKRNEPVS